EGSRCQIACHTQGTCDARRPNPPPDHTERGFPSGRNRPKLRAWRCDLETVTPRLESTGAHRRRRAPPLGKTNSPREEGARTAAAHTFLTGVCCIGYA